MIVAGLNGTPRYEQTLSASSGCALPLKTTIFRIGGEASLSIEYLDYAEIIRTPHWSSCGEDEKKRGVDPGDPAYPTSSTLSGETIAYAIRVIRPTASIPWTESSGRSEVERPATNMGPLGK